MLSPCWVGHVLAHSPADGPWAAFSLTVVSHAAVNVHLRAFVDADFHFSQV